MDSTPQLTLPPAALSGAKEAIACTVLGTVLSTAYVLCHFCTQPIRSPSLTASPHSVYGISILQAYIYFRNSYKDSTYMRGFVSEHHPSRLGELCPNGHYPGDVSIVCIVLNPTASRC